MTNHPCRYAGDDEPRYIPDRHATGDEDEPEHDPDCPGCLPCPEQHCAVCTVTHVDHERVCPTCLGATRDDLQTITDLYVHLVDEATQGGADGRLAASRPIPGGDAQVLAAGGSNGGQVAWYDEAQRLARDGRRAGFYLPGTAPARRADSHRNDERRGEPVPTRQLLEQWEDTWLAELGHTRRGPATRQARARAIPIDDPRAPRIADVDGFLGTVEFLRTWTTWAAGRLDSFPDYALDLRRHATALEGVLHDGIRLESGNAPCFRCGGDLVRKVADPKPCKHVRLAKKIADHYDEPGFTLGYLLPTLRRIGAGHVADEHPDCTKQGGRSDTYVCTRCHWRYDNASYWFAVRAGLEAERQAKKNAAHEAAENVAKFVATNLDLELLPWQRVWLEQHFINHDALKPPKNGATT